MFQLNQVVYKDILTIEDLFIPGQRITCIVGESGGGKTTLLKLLNHMISPDRGQILYRGQDIMEVDPIAHRREVVMLPQTPIIFPGTIGENLNIGREFAGLETLPDHKLEQALAQIKLSKELGLPAEELSGGEKQRIALARILLMEPEVLLLDEPSSALDEDTEKLIVETLVEFAAQKNKTLVMVTHSKQIAAAYAHFIVTVAAGRIKAREVLTQ